MTHSAAPRVPVFCSYHILTSSVIYYWTDTRQHGIYLLNKQTWLLEVHVEGTSPASEHCNFSKRRIWILNNFYIHILIFLWKGHIIIILIIIRYGYFENLFWESNKALVFVCIIILFQTNDALVAPLLRLKDNNCHVVECEKVLIKSKKYNELVILYQTKGSHRKGL